MNKTLTLLILAFSAPGCTLFTGGAIYGASSLFSATDSFILSTPIISVDALSDTTALHLEGEAAGPDIGPYYGLQISQDHVGLGIGLRRHLAAFLGSDSSPYINAGFEAFRWSNGVEFYDHEIKSLYVLGFGSHFKLTSNIILDTRLSYKTLIGDSSSSIWGNDSQLEGIGFDLGLVF